MFMRILTGILRPLFLFLFFIQCVFPDTTFGIDPTRIGVSAPLTGPAAAWGNDLRNVLAYANETLAHGKFSFVFEDDQCDPKLAVTVAKKLSAIDKVQAVFTVCGAVTLVVGPMYQQAHITVMAPLATPSRISGLGEYIFRTGLSDRFAAEKLGDYLASKHKKIGILTEQNEYSVGFFKDLSSHVNKLGLTVVPEEFQSVDQDFKGQLLRLKSQGIDGLVVNTNVERPFASILKQMKQLKIELPIYGAYLPGSEAFLSLAGPLAEGIVFVDFPSANELLNSDGQKLYQEFIKRYGPLQSWSYAFPATFEAFRSMQQAIDSGQPLKDYLRTSKFAGVFGSYSFNEQGDIVGPVHSLRRINDGKNIPVHP